MNPEAISSWTQNSDWILFAGMVAWTLAAVAASKNGQRRDPIWLWGSALCAIAALGAANSLLQYYHYVPWRFSAGIGAALPATALLIVAWMSRRMSRGRLRFLAFAGTYLLIWCATGAREAHAAASGMSGQARYVFQLAPDETAAAVLQSACALGACLWIYGKFLASLPVAAENRAALRRRAWFFVLLLAAASAAGFTATEWRCHAFLSDQAERMVWRVRTAALGLDLSAMLRLSGKPSDKRMPAYAIMTTQLQKIIAANADVLGAYLWTVRSGHVSLLAHETRDQAGGYPPGLAPEDSGTGDARSFGRPGPFLALSVRPSAKAAVVTANQRINDPTDRSNQTPFAWLGLDFNPSPWIRGIADLRLQMIAGTLLAVLVLAVGYGWITRIEIERDSEREKLALVESERVRFARDLHDGLGQTLTGLAWRAKALSNGLSGNSAGEASELAGMLSAAVGEAHAIALAHAPPALQSGGLPGGLGWLAENTRKLFGVTCRIQAPEKLPKFSDAAAHALLQIAREAVHNAVRHGHAGGVEIRLTPSHDEWTLEVIDDGRGMPAFTPSATSLGLRMIAGRVRELGGSVEFLPNTPTGVRVRCRFPAATVLRAPA